MTTFAQRLIARSAGQSAGLPLLLPRSVSPFETSEPLALEETTEATVPPRTGRSTSPAYDLVRTPSVSPLQGRARETPHVEAPKVETDWPAARPQPGTPTSEDRSGRSDQASLMASRQRPEHAGTDEQRPAREISPPAHVIRETERPVALADRTVAIPAAPNLTADDARVERAVAAPQISIGRIEVQFLPAETPAPAPRPEQQRTRGFDAYARARRGIPR